MPMEYLPFAAAELQLDSCDLVLNASTPEPSIKHVCGLLVQVCGCARRLRTEQYRLRLGTRGSCRSLSHTDCAAPPAPWQHHAEERCSCWINLPAFKANSWKARLIDTVAGWFKIPSRVATYFEMTAMPIDPEHIDRLVHARICRRRGCWQSLRGSNC